MTDFWATHKIYPSITTTHRADWHQMIKDATALNLTEVCLFPTCLDYTARQEFYAELGKTKIKSIPFVHLRGEDTTWEELDFLTERFKTKVFNIHPSALERFKSIAPDYLKVIYIENFPTIRLDVLVVKQTAGVCIDFAHLEEARQLSPEEYKQDLSIMEDSLHGCAHLSAVKGDSLSYHFLDNLSEMDYLKNYPAELFPPILAIELENPLAQQLEIIDYIKKML